MPPTKIQNIQPCVESEFNALKEVVDALKPLGHDACVRVLTYVLSILGVEGEIYG